MRHYNGDEACIRKDVKYAIGAPPQRHRGRRAFEAVGDRRGDNDAAEVSIPVPGGILTQRSDRLEAGTRARWFVYCVAGRRTFGNSVAREYRTTSIFVTSRCCRCPSRR